MSSRRTKQSRAFWLGVLAAALPILAVSAPSGEPTTTPSTPIAMDSRFSGFDAIAYVQRHDPALANQAEAISHWAGYYGVNPLLLARMAGLQLREGKWPGLPVRRLAERLSNAKAGLMAAGRKAPAQIAPALATTMTLSPDSAVQLLQATRQDMLDAGLSMTLAVTSERPPALDLPFAAPQAWQFNGVHTWTGDDDGSPMSSLDFTRSWALDWGSDTSEDWVAASHDGEVTVLSSCFVQVQHPQGWATRYYHLDNVVVVTGQQVQAGDLLANYAGNKQQALCSGGHSTGPHVHFALLRDGQYAGLGNVPLSGYLVHPGSSSYDTNHDRMWLEKRDRRYYAFSEQIAAEPGDNRIDYRYNGMWYAPEHDGHGMNIEISEWPDGEGSRKSVFLVMYTYDDAGDANFYVGNVDFNRWRSDESMVIDLLQTAGGDLSNLAAIDFTDPEQVMPAGQAEVAFDDCNTARVDLLLYERTSGQPVEHSLELLRLIGVPPHVCEAASLPLP